MTPHNRNLEIHTNLGNVNYRNLYQGGSCDDGGALPHCWYSTHCRTSCSNVLFCVLLNAFKFITSISSFQENSIHFSKSWILHFYCFLLLFLDMKNPHWKFWTGRSAVKTLYLNVVLLQRSELLQFLLKNRMEQLILVAEKRNKIKGGITLES